MTQEALLEAIIDNVKDWPRYHILADVYEERGEQSKADCLRWMADNHKRPMYGARWYNISTVPSSNSDPESDIPSELFDHLRGEPTLIQNRGGAPEAKDYEGFHNALTDLMRAWDKARAEGWNPQ